MNQLFPYSLSNQYYQVNIASTPQSKLQRVETTLKYKCFQVKKTEENLVVDVPNHMVRYFRAFAKSLQIKFKKVKVPK